MYFGVAVVSGEWHALLGFVLVAAAYVRKIRIEEANLMQAFGDEYQEYRSATSALIPGVY
jgi:protein-S-isoprenylcysteine O-methyltransferase Ste14